MFLNHDYIVISAHHCAPNKGSEHAVGWNAIKELSKNNNLIVITEDNDYKHDLLRETEKLNTGNQVLVYFVKHGQVSDGRKNNLRVGYYLTYILYQIRVFKLVRKLINKYDIKLIHHLTIVGFREPGFLWLLPKPFIWGPVGGLVYSPPELYSDLSLKMRAFQYVRNFITWLQFNLSIRVRLAYKKTQTSGKFIAAEPSIGDKFVSKFGGVYDWIPETGSTIDTIVRTCDDFKVNQQQRDGTLNLLWLGALIDIKPMKLLIDSITESKYKEKVVLNVVGDGASKDKFKSYAIANNVNVNFIGWVEHSKVKENFYSSDLFCLFSMKDLTTNVVFESLSCGTPVICLNHHGYSYIIDGTCGMKININERNTMVRDIASKLNSVMENRDRLNVMSRGALEKANKFTWENNFKKISDIYCKVTK
ncbi:TPA: glycosyltransferase [Vibrio campbellii]|uniref:glycosyltransferase n=1 Tax=Vibrio campbellii TaxID=680 RepID=UPI003909B074